MEPVWMSVAHSSEGDDDQEHCKRSRELKNAKAAGPGSLCEQSQTVSREGAGQ